MIKKGWYHHKEDISIIVYVYSNENGRIQYAEWNDHLRIKLFCGETTFYNSYTEMKP